MFQAQPDARPAVVHGPFHELAEAIRRGCKGTRQGWNALNGPAPDQLCALGAAERGGYPLYRIPMNYYCKIKTQNDHHGMTREQIADALDAIR